jgi:predicted phosphoribosyltransferase
MFADRMDAGVALAGKLLHLKDKNPAVFALARGGVPVGFEIAVVLAAPLDAVLVRKIGAPHHEELAIGAVADAPQRAGQDARACRDRASEAPLFW